MESQKLVHCWWNFLVRKAVGPQVGKVVQGTENTTALSLCSQRRLVTDLLKMSDETDLDILNNSMDTMVEQFPEELLPVAAMLTARLVCF